MARELRISIWCDPCIESGKQTDGEEFDISVNGGDSRTVAFCPEHVGAFLSPLVRLLANAPLAAGNSGGATKGGGKPAKAHGAAVETARNTSPWRCPFDDGYAVTGRASLGKHLKAAHGSSIIEAREKFPAWSATLPTRPGLGADSPGYRERVCPECGFTTKTGQGFAVHLRSRHMGLDVAERRRILDAERSSFEAHAIGA